MSQRLPPVVGILARARQRGAATLTLTMLLLFGTSVVVMSLNRGLVFDQRISANELWATSAREVAEAGVEWATGMLNTPYSVNSADCTFATTATNTFRRRYVQTQLAAATPSTAFAPAANAYPGCSLSANNTLACNCPAVPGNPATAAVASLSAVAPKFTVQFLPVDATSVKLRSTGCLPTSGSCSANDATSGAAADAKAVVEVILKLKPVIRAVPAAALTAGGKVDLSGSYNIVNKDVATNGILVDAGSTISQGNGVSLTSIPGVPSANALIGNDASLSSLADADPSCNKSTLFNAYFGSTLEEYAAEPTTKTLSCNSASDCESQVTGAYQDGWRAFYFASNLHLSGDHTLGSQVQPVTIVTPMQINISGNWTLYGLLFSNKANLNDTGSGSTSIHGAEVACNNVKANGNGTLTYDPKALANLTVNNSRLVRVPGSWRDR